MLWKYENQVLVVNFSKRHITIQVQDESQKVEWLLIGFYGVAKAGKRYLAWQFLQDLKPNHVVLWLLIGDFNEILF